MFKSTMACCRSWLLFIISLSYSIMPSTASSRSSSPPASKSNDACYPAPSAHSKSTANTYYMVDTGDQTSYKMTGDINLGCLVEVLESSKESERLCSDKLDQSAPMNLQYIEALAFGVQLINKDKALLPNVKLGFVMLDYCTSRIRSIAQSLSFLPRMRIASSPISGNDSSGCKSGNRDSIHHYDVVGVLGPFRSSCTIDVSQLYTSARLPLLSYFATADSLTDSLNHKYFMRVVPEDYHQVQAMLRFIKDQQWNYISVLYEDDNYGKAASRSILNTALDYDVCIAASQITSSHMNNEAFLVTELLRHPKARVVILFMQPEAARPLFKELRRRNVTGHFIWICSDSLADRESYYEEYPEFYVGAITFIYHAQVAPDTFYKYFENISPHNSTNPWFKPIWEQGHNCSFEKNTCNAKTDSKYDYVLGTSLAIDSIFTFAHAIDKLLRDICPDARGKDANDCIEGETLLRYLLNTTFEGHSGRIKFNENGDSSGKYQLRQIVYKHNHPGATEKYTTRFTQESVVKDNIIEVPIGLYNSDNSHLDYIETDISWEHIQSDDGTAFRNATPESTCSTPCIHGEYKYKFANSLPCCWDCLRCDANQIMVDGKVTTCKACSMFTWPDPSTGFKKCSIIVPNTHLLSDGYVFTQICIGSIGIIITLIISIAYLNLRSTHVIEIANPGQSFVQLGAIMAGYTSLLVIQFQPSQNVCDLLFFANSFIYAWLYTPLLVKTYRSYKIIQKLCEDIKVRPKYVSSKWQILMCGIIISIQIANATFVMIFDDATTIKSQPIVTEKAVILECRIRLLGKLSCFLYNFGLLVLCAYFILRIGKLPYKFYEYRSISIFISTALILWLAYFVVFFSVQNDAVRVIATQTILLLNLTAAIIILFLPKFYALIFLPDAKEPPRALRRRFNPRLLINPNTHIHPQMPSTSMRPQMKSLYIDAQPFAGGWYYDCND